LDFDATGGTTIIRHSVSEYLLRSLHSVTAPRRFFYWLCLRAATGLFRTEALRRLPNLFTQYFAPETGAHSEQVSRLFILILSALFVVLFVLEKPLRHLPPESITRGTVLYQRSRPNAHFENPLELL
jgi:hypothetical protein